jgi:peptide-methionine (S)-S-oxide reductase
MSLETATFGGGCFWCVEAVFQRLRGVSSVVSGYTGGSTANPTYEQICTGRTGHAEVIQIEFDPDEISFVQLLEVFFKTHDPTTLNQQGADRGTQYRSAIYFHSPQQEQTARETIESLNAAKVFNRPIVTEVTAAPIFYPAEDYHQNYYNLNPNNGYCQVVAREKVDKLHRYFADRIK